VTIVNNTVLVYLKFAKRVDLKCFHHRKKGKKKRKEKRREGKERKGKEGEKREKKKERKVGHYVEERKKIF